MSWNQADAPLLLESFPKRWRMPYEAAWFGGSHKYKQNKQGMKNTLALSIDKMLGIYLLCPQSEHHNNPFQNKHSKHFHQQNRFT